MSEIQIIDNAGIEVFAAQERAAIDSQIATAKQYPRNLRNVIQNSIVIATMDEDTARSMRYAKPVGGKQVVGASVHLTRIAAQQYGNLRVQKRIKEIGAKTIVAEAVVLDLETNFAVCEEVRRSILTKDGKRYADSVIETNAMACMAIAERNALTKILPKPLIDAVYNEAFKMANGDLSDNAKLLKARNLAFEYFLSEYGATEEQVLNLLGVKTINAVKAEHIADLRGYQQALNDKEVNPDELFKSVDDKQVKKASEVFESAINNMKPNENFDKEESFMKTPEDNPQKKK